LIINDINEKSPSYYYYYRLSWKKREAIDFSLSGKCKDIMEKGKKILKI